MPQHARTPDLLERLAVLEEEVARLRRASIREVDELPFYPSSIRGLIFEDSTSFITVMEVIFAPRTESLSLGLLFIGDQVSAVNTGGEWQVLLNDTVVMSGAVAATYSYQTAAQLLDVRAYLADAELKIRIQVRRTAGASTGGRYGGGGAIGIAPRYARLI